MRLTREVRCFLTGEASVPHPSLREERGTLGSARNSWAGWPASDALDPFVRLRITVEGDPDNQTGYLADTASLDTILRSRALPILNRRDRSGTGRFGAASVLCEVFETLSGAVDPPARLYQLALLVSSFTRFSCRAGEFPVIRMTQSFEFSAAHRLCCPEWSDEENRAVFGKCANPNGHGHNYVVDITIAGEVDAKTGTIIDLDHFQRVVREHVIDRFDHTHLNLDCSEFQTLNPSVENIARVIWDRLHGKLSPSRLSCVRVWETPKTCAEYTGD